jgi:aspartyl/asparaginyl-tRNA synthetase
MLHYSYNIFCSAKDLNLGCSLEAKGEIIPSSHPGQAVEMTARELKLVGKCNPQVRERHTQLQDTK